MASREFTYNEQKEQCFETGGEDLGIFNPFLLEKGQKPWFLVKTAVFGKNRSFYRHKWFQQMQKYSNFMFP